MSHHFCRKVSSISSKIAPSFEIFSNPRAYIYEKLGEFLEVFTEKKTEHHNLIECSEKNSQSS